MVRLASVMQVTKGRANEKSINDKSHRIDASGRCFHSHQFKLLMHLYETHSATLCEAQFTP